MSYYKECLEHLYNKGEITCFDIQRITNTTCPHKVIEQLKQKQYINKEKWVTKNGKSFKIHYLKKQLELI